MKNTLALVLMVFGLVGCTPEYKENGFSNQQTYEAAMQGGFLSEKDYRKAKKYNYTTKQEWDDAIALSKDKGYHSLDEYLSMFCILILASCAEVLDPPKYQYGDCITPTDKTSSWYGEYAKVDAYVRVADDISGSAYVLWFPTFKVN